MQQLEGAAELLAIVDDSPDTDECPRAEPAWKILVVDDDKEVHEATRFALAGRTILGRQLELIFTQSADEAKRALVRHAGIAVILLDVVMEEHDSGLKLARWIRNQGYTNARIILRTGQPGYAPELEVITEYDINDYRSKAELTRTRLITTITAALRSYEQIETIDRSRRGLEMIVTSCSQLFKHRQLATFSQGVLMQMCSLFRLPAEGMICAGRHGDGPCDIRVVSGIGTGEDYCGRTLEEVEGREELKALVTQAIQSEEAICDGSSIVSFDGADRERFVTFLEGGRPLSAIDEALLKVFAANISVGFENVGLIGRLDRLAYFDEELGIANRNRLFKDISRRLETDRTPARVLFLMVTTYGETLEAFGHETALALLKEVVRHVEEAPDGCGLYRYGEAILAAIIAEDDPRTDFFRALGTEHFKVEGQLLRAKFAVGTALIEAFRVPSDICHEAYAALAHARTQDRDWVDFEPEIIHDARERMELTSALRHAVARGEILTHFQPILDIETGACVGAEALARWTSNGVLIPPADFIPIAGQTDLAFPIMALALERAAHCRRTIGDRHAHLVFSINLSATDLERETMAQDIEELLARFDLPASLIQFEITEDELIGNLACAEVQLSALKAMGCRVAVDDFGTGYSSLAYLNRLPVDSLKLDRHFTASLGAGGRSQAVIRSAVELGRLLGVEVLAEGVETVEQHHLLRELGCRRAQGFHYARPMSGNEFAAWLERKAVPNP